MAPLVGWANNRWEYGTPSNDLAAAGVLAHVLDGDGYCLKFAFGASARERTRVAGRFVRTFWHEQEQAAGNGDADG